MVIHQKEVTLEININTSIKIKKNTSGAPPEISKIVNLIYKSNIIAETHKALSIKVAEASKVIENTQLDFYIDNLKRTKQAVVYDFKSTLDRNLVNGRL